MLIKFINDYRQIILSCAEQNYTKNKTEDVLLAIELYRYKKYQQIPRIKELNQIINTIYKTKSDENSEENNEKNASYLWISEQDSCSACSQLDGQIFNEKPQRPHPNCNCEIKEISEEETDSKRDKSGFGKDPKTGKPVNKADTFDKMKQIASENRANGKPFGNGLCARGVRAGLEAGGFDIPPKDYEHAENFGKLAEKNGFEKIFDQNTKYYLEKPGDIAVMQPLQNKDHGHVAMNTDQGWYSDFEQKDKFGSNGYRDRGTFEIYRNSNW